MPEKAMAPHSTLAWKIPWTEEPGRPQSMGSLRVRHDWATSLSLFTFMDWRRKWQPTPVFLPGKSQGWWSLVGCCLWGRTWKCEGPRAAKTILEWRNKWRTLTLPSIMSYYKVLQGSEIHQLKMCLSGILTYFKLVIFYERVDMGKTLKTK